MLTILPPDYRTISQWFSLTSNLGKYSWDNFKQETEPENLSKESLLEFDNIGACKTLLAYRKTT